jgi:peptide/nickel transport system substrate-binding protein/oligopeptide transport system substrate-binding protein
VVLGGRFETWPLADSVAGLSRRLLRYDPVSGLFGLVVVRPDGPLAAAELREALAMAIDRDALAGALAPGGWTAATRVVGADPEAAPGTIGERWTGLSLAQRRSEAAGRIARWTARHGAFRPLRIGLPDGPGADRLFAMVRADFASIGLTAERAGAAGADLQLLDLTARYSRPEWYLNQLSCAAGRGLCSSIADARLAEARAAADPVRRAALLAEAEAELTSANVYIPLGTPVRWSLVRDGVGGFSLNSAGFHPLTAFALPPG